MSPAEARAEAISLFKQLDLPDDDDLDRAPSGSAGSSSGTSWRRWRWSPNPTFSSSTADNRFDDDSGSNVSAFPQAHPRTRHRTGLHHHDLHRRRL
jgi:hypothetical protein